MNVTRPSARPRAIDAAARRVVSLAVLAAFGGALGTLACSRAEQAAASEPASAGAPFELGDVVHARIAELERELAPPAHETPPVDPELEERLRGLASEITTAQARWKTLYLEEARGLGDPAVETLGALLKDPAFPDAGKIGALELIAAVDTPSAARALLALAESPVDWIRRHAVFQLGETTQEWTVPALVRRLFYETDGEAVVWIARSLARFGNFAGLDGLFALERAGSDAARALAANELARQADATGAASAAELYAAWRTPGHALVPRPEPSPRHRLAVWRLVLEISGERFQLRGVDEARFVLARSGEWVAALLAEALHDRDPWTRVHSAQCLDRMGARARCAEPALIAGLNDPALAPAAAEALGGVGGQAAAAALAARLAPGHDHELRVAAARGLGRLAEDGAVTALRSVLAPSEPLDLRQTAAQSLAKLGAGADVARFLLECLASPEADGHGAEAALETWLRAAAEDLAPAAEVLRGWDALAPDTGGAAPSVDADRRRRAQRRELLERRLEQLLREGQRPAR